MRRDDRRRWHAKASTTRRLVAAGGLSAGATLAMAGVAQATTYVVGSTADPGSTALDCLTPTNTDCTLREAITETNGNPGADTILFRSGLTGTINLDSGSGQLDITDALTLQGPGAGQMTINAGGNSRVIYANPAAKYQPVSISGLTITGGQGGTGAGIFGHYADLTVTNSVVSGNNSTGSGGGIGANGGNHGPGTLDIAGSTISGNTASQEGGGVFAAGGSGIPTTIRNSTISGNQGGGYGGGGVTFDYSSPGTVKNSTIYGNSSTQDGGGLYHFGAPSGPGLVVTDSTITHNSSAIRAGGIAASDDPGYTQPVLRNTIVSGNTAPLGPDLSAKTSSMDAAFSLIGSVDPATTINATVPFSNIFGVNPQLGPLQSNGGSTRTVLPADTSPAINKGKSFALGTDQRGLTRPVEFPGIANSTAAGADGADIGAVEVQLPPPPPPPAPSGGGSTPSGQRAAAKKRCKKKFKHSKNKRNKCLKKAKRLPV
jgi:hypothetical protein